ncbi:MAG: CotH kinase family protein, partial [Bacteroidales bacterium]|nr:CotH kinase family protein [Bacteroidales bacterium]
MNLSRRFPATAAFVIALLLSASCGQPVAVGDLLSVQVQESVLVFPEKGSVRLPFVVDEPGYVFDLQEDVVLYPATGNSPHTSQCVLSRVERDTVAGRYVAVLTDSGVSRDYSVDVLLGIRSGDGSILFSEPFQCRGECYVTRGVYVDTGLPVLYVNTEDGRAVTSKEDYLKAEMFLLGADGKPAASAADCSIRGRGNTTWEWPKKPYLLKLDKKASLLGMPAHKRWVLLANFMDRTLMRNLVAMRVSSMTSLAWTPRCRSVELVLN